MSQSLSASANEGGWLAVLRRYLVATAAAHLVWETSQIRLYTIWREGTMGEIGFAILHCTAGDVLIALASLVLGLAVFGDGQWPRARYRPVAFAAIAIGLAYTIFSEWRNVTLGRWTYADSMLVLPPFGTGLSPLLQWAIIPPAALWFAVRRRRPGRRLHGRRT